MGWLVPNLGRGCVSSPYHRVNHLADVPRQVRGTSGTWVYPVIWRGYEDVYLKEHPIVVALCHISLLVAGYQSQCPDFFVMYRGFNNGTLSKM
jgi:hypothetical protein